MGSTVKDNNSISVRQFFSKYALYFTHIECHSRTNSWATGEKEIYQLNFIIQCSDVMV